ncbi:MAG: hypothetical protein LBG44_05615 [Gemmatimonadota bacterium]|jgi:hypothetical protein|nr:hypothetical protein [Gemmatimonadota bacterium]
MEYQQAVDFEFPAPSLTPTIERGVRGRRGEEGMLLRAPGSEALSWDLEMEVATARREWLCDQQAWWIGASYFRTVIDIVLRSFPSVLVLGATEDHLISRDGTSVLQGRLL